METPHLGPPVVRARSLWRGAAIIGVAAGVLALLAACGGGSGGGTAAPSGGGTSSAQTAGTKVTATLTEYHIALSRQTFSAGTYTFVVTNSGTTTHALTVNGPGVSNQQTNNLQPGSSANLTVTLKSGSYDIFCPVDAHKALGMNMNVTVPVGSGSGGASTMPSMSGKGATAGMPAGGNGNGY